MQLLLKRKIYNQKNTIGELFINGIFFCNTLEDKVRVPFVKVPKETAISKGTYKVIFDFSNRFQKIMPHILNVPNFEGIRIHAGNTEIDTEGCILVGIKSENTIISSKVTYTELVKRIQNEKDITIVVS